jgi:hypothetical protein
LHGFVVDYDEFYVMDTDRFGEVPYHPDVRGVKGKREIVIEVDGKVGHSSQRSHNNRETEKREYKKRVIEFYEFSTGEIVGGWKDSNGHKHIPWSDAILCDFLKLKNTSDNRND